MNKKFALFGNALSRNEAKMVFGGGEDEGVCRYTWTSSSDCPTNRSCRSGECPDAQQLKLVLEMLK